ncbi:hypothetical protein [Streptomyces sp. NPDC090025]|uniref:hypothetical protein n=1 Tax=Streptomyces sp. NPDC090025 TaxID=3365922 RepID=UPI0038360207
MIFLTALGNWKRDASVASGGLQPVRVVDGAGCLDRIEVRVRLVQELAEAVASCRAAYDRVLLIAAVGRECPDVADVYVEVTQDEPVEPADVRWVIEDGRRAQRVLPRTPERIAQQWCQSARHGTDPRRPVLGHILIEPTHAVREACHDLVWVSDEQLGHQHVQVLGRLPAPDRDPQTLRPLPVTDGRQAAAYDAAARTVRAALPRVRNRPGRAPSWPGQHAGDTLVILYQLGEYRRLDRRVPGCQWHRLATDGLLGFTDVDLREQARAISAGESYVLRVTVA